jgi:alpha-beta hydrolase superfamily lysophospholipase
MVRLVSKVLLAGLSVALVAGSLVRSRPSPRRRSHEPRLDGEALIASDGARLPIISWQPGQAVEAVVLGLHGYGDYCRAFSLAGPWFADRCFAFYAYDQRGFGKTESRGLWPGMEALIEDLADAVAALRERHEGIPLIVLGESMGGSVALGALGTGRVTGVERLILAAPGVRGNIPLRQLHDLALRLAVLALPWLAVELRRGARPWLAPEEAVRLAEDPLMLRALSVGTYDGLIELAELASAEPQVDLPPTLLLHGALDRTVPRGAIHTLAEMLGDAVTLRLYPERHHLLLHEVDAERVLADCLDWIKGRPPGNGGAGG